MRPLALPAKGGSSTRALAALRWVVTGYTLTLAGLLLVAGSLGDRHGHRRVFVTGVTWFAVASLLCGIAPTAGTLIAARALQGIGAALLTPGSLAILQASFIRDDRGKAIGAWSGFSGVGAAIGPFLGEWLCSGRFLAADLRDQLPVAAAVAAIAAATYPNLATRTPMGRSTWSAMS